MERLTRVVDGSVVFPTELVWVTLTPDNEIMYKLLTRLAAYEDTGLTPEEIELMKEAQGIGEGMTPQRLAEILTADQAGRLVVLPCNVGDTVYLPLRDGIHGVRVKGIRIAASGKDTVLHLDIGAGEFRWGSDKGRTWFATRQEAEAAVEREEGQA